LILSPQHFIFVMSVRPGCCGHCCLFEQTDHGRYLSHDFGDWSYSKDHFLWSWSLIIVIYVILSPYDNPFVAIAMLLIFIWSLSDDHRLIIAWLDDHFQMINVLSSLDLMITWTSSYHRLTIRLLLSLSCSVSLWLESAQRSRSLEEGLGGRAPVRPACLRPGLPPSWSGLLPVGLPVSAS